MTTGFMNSVSTVDQMKAICRMGIDRTLIREVQEKNEAMNWVQ